MIHRSQKKHCRACNEGAVCGIELCVGQLLEPIRKTAGAVLILK
jgi:hypothetical protein